MLTLIFRAKPGISWTTSHFTDLRFYFQKRVFYLLFALTLDYQPLWMGDQIVPQPACKTHLSMYKCPNLSVKQYYYPVLLMKNFLWAPALWMYRMISVNVWVCCSSYVLVELKQRCVDIISVIICLSSAVPGGAELLPARVSEDARTEGASLPAQVCPEPTRSVSAGCSFLPHLLRHEDVTVWGKTLTQTVWFCDSVSWIYWVGLHIWHPAVFLRVGTTGWSVWSSSTSLPSPSPLSTCSSLMCSARSHLLKTTLSPCRSMPRLWGNMHSEGNTGQPKVYTLKHACTHSGFSSGASSWSWPHWGSTYFSSSQQ